MKEPLFSNTVFSTFFGADTPFLYLLAALCILLTTCFGGVLWQMGCVTIKAERYVGSEMMFQCMLHDLHLRCPGCL